MRRRTLAVATGVFAIVTGVVIWVGTRRPEPPLSVWGVEPPSEDELDDGELIHYRTLRMDVFRDVPGDAADAQLVAAPRGDEQDRFAKVRVLQAPSRFRLRLHRLRWLSSSFAADDEDLGIYSATGKTRDIDGTTWREFVHSGD